ncbi:uncharacterized protein HD556DRAFT_1302738 [Suillus plorans]|uniref:Uncharacterized protein n=1 Tax=Suillus plorans TaxID=116603 RepID=A0A9P7E4H1_9AGAM|nr:uncharacterized protein HD556DRAFT_1302738 [Suillus plorans]KAG1810437.1 hypothetical protein HD556DRAFT_1302738 [Suillus plorans]
MIDQLFDIGSVHIEGRPGYQYFDARGCACVRGISDPEMQNAYRHLPSLAQRTLYAVLSCELRLRLENRRNTPEARHLRLGVGLVESSISLDGCYSQSGISIHVSVSIYVHRLQWDTDGTEGHCLQSAKLSMISFAFKVRWYSSMGDALMAIKIRDELSEREIQVESSYKLFCGPGLLEIIPDTVGFGLNSNQTRAKTIGYDIRSEGRHATSPKFNRPVNLTDTVECKTRREALEETLDQPTLQQVWESKFSVVSFAISKLGLA